MASGDNRVTRVCLSSSPNYLCRVRRIVACLVDSVGMDARESADAPPALDEVCANAIRHGSPRGSADRVYITFRVARSTICAEVSDCGGLNPSSTSPGAGLGLKIVPALSDSISFVRNRSGPTVRLTKRAKRRR